LSSSDKAYCYVTPFVLSGITGPVAVSEIGDRVADFDLWDMTSSSTMEFRASINQSKRNSSLS